VSYGCWWIDFEDLLVTHADADGLPAIQAMGIDMDLRTREKPAHGQHFESSLTVPLLFPIDRHNTPAKQWRARFIQSAAEPVPQIGDGKSIDGPGNAGLGTICVGEQGYMSHESVSQKIDMADLAKASNPSPGSRPLMKSRKK